MMELPKYHSHKIVQAAKINRLISERPGEATVYFIENFQPITVGTRWYSRYQGSAQDMGYYVRYKDGFESWSPSKAFEEGYTRIEDHAKADVQQPSIGRIVHYQSYGTPGGEHPSIPRAAIVTAVNDDGTLDLCVLNPTGMFFNRGVVAGGPECATPTPGCWNWPPRT